MQKDFQISPDSFKITSLSKQLNQIDLLSLSKKPSTRFPVISQRYPKNKYQDASRLGSNEVSSFIEAKSLTPVRMKKKRILSAERETYSYIHTESLNIGHKSSIRNSSGKETNITTSIEEQPRSDKGENGVWVLKSLFENRPGTVFFDYPDEVGIKKDKTQVIWTTPQRELGFRVSESFNYPCIVNTLRRAGFIEGGNLVMDIAGVVNNRVYHGINDGIKVNHFPGSSCLGRKDSMWKGIEKMMSVFGESFGFCPSTYVLPEDYRRFNLDREESPRDLWIVKPPNSACGRGIKIINKSTPVNLTTGHLISKYIKHPHLIRGFKYDLRVYVAVTSYYPLKIYMYNEGLVRFATVPYSSKKSNLKNKCIHLTNFSINKDSPTFINNVHADHDNYGSKWSFRALKEHYKDTGINSDKIFKDIQDIVIKTLISSESYICAKLQKYNCRSDSCYELFGFDVLIDKTLKSWLLEVNIYPSLSLTSPLDMKIKYMLVTDLYSLIGICPGRKAEGELKGVGRTVGEVLGSGEMNVLMEFEEEFGRRGGFERIFPEREGLERYKEYFLTQRYLNLLLWKFVESDKSWLRKMRRG